MKPVIPTIAILIAIASLVNCEHLLAGNTVDRVQPANYELVEYYAFPFMKRVKNYFYSDPENRKIQGIQAIDMLFSKSSIHITAGGIGHSFVNLRMKSERWGGLSYYISVYFNRDIL